MGVASASLTQSRPCPHGNPHCRGVGACGVHSASLTQSRSCSHNHSLPGESMPAVYTVPASHSPGHVHTVIT
ncbi:MAG: hypothetical protein IJR63_02600 [Synergistaceae bacterium]|nr:hypothetical protein [Synergistaceae bacterium]